MAKVEIRKNGAGGGGGGTPVVFTSVTYAQLVAFIGASGLTQGSFYLITDFQTIYDQPDFDSSGNPKIAVSTLSGSVEPIFVQAVSTNEISNQAISSVYENDELLYDWTFQTTEITGSPAKGLITRRTTDVFLNGKRNSTPYDSREVLFKRYESVSGSGIFNSYKDTGFASSNVPTFGVNSTDNNIGNFWNNDVMANVTNYPFVLPNTVFGDNSSFNNIGDQCFNITFGDLYCINNNIGNYFFNNLIGDNFQNNTIGNFFANNTIGNNFQSNNIGNFFGINYISLSYNLYPNTIGNNFESNTIGDNFLNNTIGNNFQNNQISNYFSFNNITNNFQSNNIGNYFGIDSGLNVSTNNISDNFKFNNIGDLFLLNSISTNFQYNNISDYFGFFSGNIIGTGFTNNSIGNYFENTVGNDFSRNNIGALFGFSGRNTIGDNFQNNTIGAESDTNTIGDNFKDNIFGSNFSGNTIGIDCQKNTGNSWFNGNNIGTGFQYNFLGNWFKGNTVGNSVTYLNIDANFDTQNIANNFTTKDWVAGLTTGFVNNTSGFLESKSYGLASQYVRADGQFANFPSVAGGGSSVVYYLNGSVNQGTFVGNTYYQLSTVPVIGTGTDFSIAANGIIARFITDAGVPNLLSVPSGNWNFQFYFSANSSGGSPDFYINIYKYDGISFTSIASSSLFPEVITNGTAIDIYTTSVAVPTTSLSVTDRIAIEVYVNNSGKTITLHTEDSHLCEVITTFSTGISALNGLTQSVQYFTTGTSGTDFAISSATNTHTFNLPVASGTNTGKLSSTDWSTFNNKIGGSGTANYVTKFTGSGTVGNSIIRDNGSTVSINSAPLGFAKFGVTNTTTSISIYTTNTYVDPAPSLQQENYGAYHTITAANTWYNVGGYFSASGAGTANYSVKLSDGTEAVGKFLKSVTADGRANWATLSVADTGLTLTTTGTSGAATLVGNTLNIPQYTGSGLTYFTEGQNTTAPNNTVYVDSLTAVSSTTDADFAIIPKGNGAILRQIPDGTVTGGNKRGANAIDFQYSRTANIQVASGTGAVCFGTNNYGVGSKVFCVGNDNNAQGNNSYLFGSSNSSTATYDFGTAFGTANQVQRRSSFASGTSNIVTSRDGAAFGDSNSITADYAYAFGGTNTASSSYAFATGIQNTASSPSSFAVGRNANTFGTRSKFALSGGQEATRGDAQFGMVVLKNRTTNATTTRLYIESAGAVSSTQIYPAANGAYRFKGSIIGKQTGTTNVAAWDIDGIIVKGATDASVVLSMANVTVVQNTPAWGTPTLTADTGAGGIAGTLNISVTGAALTNIQWVCSVQTTEVIY